MLRCLYCKSARWIWLQCIALLPYSAGGVLQNDGQVRRSAMNTEPHLISNLIFYSNNSPLKESCTQNECMCICAMVESLLLRTSFNLNHYSYWNNSKVLLSEHLRAKFSTHPPAFSCLDTWGTRSASSTAETLIQSDEISKEIAWIGLYGIISLQSNM